jgi:hypothetical protein
MIILLSIVFAGIILGLILSSENDDGGVVAFFFFVSAIIAFVALAKTDVNKIEIPISESQIFSLGLPDTNIYLYQHQDRVFLKILAPNGLKETMELRTESIEINISDVQTPKVITYRESAYGTAKIMCWPFYDEATSYKLILPNNKVYTFGEPFEN